jgi:SlyX protein
MLNETSEPRMLALRLNDLEIRYTHLQRTVEELNAVVISQDQRLEALERKVVLLAAQMGELAEREPEPRSLEEDKPPHY